MTDAPANLQPSPSTAERVLMRRLTRAIVLLTLATLLSFIGLFAGNGGLIAAAAAPCVATAALFVRLTPAAMRPAVAPLLWQYARRVAVGVRLAAVACILASVVVFLFQLGNARMRSLGAGSTYNLRAILTALDEYAAQRGAYPATLPELAECGLLYPKQLICGFDARSEDAVRREGYSSYVYLPGVAPDCRDPAVVLVYERLAWSYQNAWDGDRAYQAGFADGTVRKLSVHELAEALARDAFRRRELGFALPRTESQPTARPQAGGGD